MAAGGQPHALHLAQHALHGVVDVDGRVRDVQHLDQTVRIVDIGLDAVGHQHAVDILAPIGGHGQRRDGGAVLAAGDADDGGFAAAVFHLLVHPLEQPGQLQVYIEFHTIASC